MTDRPTEGFLLSTLTTAWSRVSYRAPWVAAALAIIVLIVSHVFVGSDASLPLYWEDEAGYLANAQVMAGVGEAPDLRGRPYYIGWSIALVPLWWIFQDGHEVYVGAVTLSVLCGIATAVPLAFELARRLRKAPRAIAQEVADKGYESGWSRVAPVESSPLNVRVNGSGDASLAKAMVALLPKPKAKGATNPFEEAQW